MRPPSPSIPEREFTFGALKTSLRLDGRAPLEMRTPKLMFGPKLGWVECSLGKTRVLANVDATIIKPSADRPYEGVMTIHSELSPMAAVEHDTLRPSETEQSISRLLDKVLRRGDAVDKESLCILAGQRVWHIRLTVHFLSDAGNMQDCACVASMAALKHFRRPEVEVVGDEIVIHPPEERAPVALALHHAPYTLTFAYFKDPDIPAILDPNKLEETLSTGALSIALNAEREICVLQKAGGVPVSPDEVMHLVHAGVERVRGIDSLVEDALRQDWSNRTVEVQ